MKKLMVSTIILLPLLILLIMLVSGAIMSLVTHIYVEQVEIVGGEEPIVLYLQDLDDKPTHQVDVNIFPLKADNQELLFESADNNIVTIDEKGVVKAEFFGQTTIKVTSKENVAKSDDQTVIVTDTKVHFVEIYAEDPDVDLAHLEMYNGDEGVKLTTRVIPTDAINKDIEWTSSNPAALSVDASGVISCNGHSDEPVTITATSKDNPEAIDTIEVICHSHIEGISLEGGDAPRETASRQVQFPAVKITPANATYTLSYSSSDQEVATVDQNGAITFLKEGQATITVTASDRDKSFTSSVTYDCTDAYYKSIQFKQPNYEFDYDQFKGQVLDIDFNTTGPDGSSRLYKPARFSKSGIIDFDAATHKFTLRNDVSEYTELGDITVTVPVTIYDSANHKLAEKETSCTVTITRKTQSVSFYNNGNSISKMSLTKKSIDVSLLTLSNHDTNAESTNGKIAILPYPLNHTDELTFAVESGDDKASYDKDAGLLQFSGVEEGESSTASIVVSAEGQPFANKLEVQYTEVPPQVQQVEVPTPTPTQPTQTETFVYTSKTLGGNVSYTVPAGYEEQTHEVVNLNDQGEPEPDSDPIVTYDPVKKEIKKLKGGFAQIKIPLKRMSSPVAYTAEEPAPDMMYIIIEVYVDMPILANNISFENENGEKINGDMWTSKDSVDFKVILSTDVPEGSITEDYMKGKEMYVNGVLAKLAEVQDRAGALIFEVAKKAFGDVADATLEAIINYSQQAKEYYDKLEAEDRPDGYPNVCSSSRNVHSSHGQLRSAPTVKQQGGATLGTLAFNDLGQSITLDITLENVAPADFEFAQAKIKEQITCENSDKVSCDSIEYKDKHHATVTLKSIHSGTGAVVLHIAGQNVTVNVDVKTYADQISVSYVGATLTNKTYTTFLDEVTFNVTLSRKDGSRDISENSASFNYGSTSGAVKMEGLSGTFTLSTVDGAKTLTVTAAGDKATFTMELKKLTAADFADKFDEMQIEYSTGDGAAATKLDPIKFGTNVSYIFPRAIQNGFTISIGMPAGIATDLLGDYGPAKAIFAKYLTMDLPQRETDANEAEWWGSEVTAVNEEKITIFVSLPSEENYRFFAGKQVTLHCAAKGDAVFTLTRVNIDSVTFSGYEMGKASDVYMGYQQVRVFAKHSYYDGANVDYLSIPVKALSQKGNSNTEQEIPEIPADMSDVIWKFTLVNNKDNAQGAESLVIEQVGNTVTYGGQTYTIIPDSNGGKSKLQDAQGATIAQNGKYEANATKVPWVDIYADKDNGNAHIYFGAVKGLSEVDIQNDYFGNFGEQQDYTPKAQVTADDSGRSFEASEGAYTFLRIEAGDGAVGGANTHFNFNVLEDDALVNVFNAQGYYNAGSNLVLQENLYGPGELGTEGENFNKATANDLFLNNASGLGKDLIYGNGYQVNTQAYNEQIRTDLENNPSKYTKGFNESIGPTFNKAYNTIIKCANPEELLNGKRQTLVLKMSYAYYCDLSYYFKFNPASKIFYTKNTVFSHIPKTAIQLYYNGDKLYAENIVMTECGTSIQADNGGEQDIQIYFKGSIDTLNYFNQPALNNLNTLVGSMFNEVVPGIKNYFEWHGKTVSAMAYKDQPNVDRIYVNVLAFAASDLSQKTFVWGKDGYRLLSESGALSSGAKIVNKNLMFSYYALTYEMMNEDGTARLDNAVANYNPGSLMFTGTADLNSLFSTNRYIRLQCEFKDKDVKNYDHIKWHMQQVYRDLSIIGETRLSHIDDLKESLKDTTWSDGSGVNSEGVPFDPPTAASNLLATALPERRQYAA